MDRMISAEAMNKKKKKKKTYFSDDTGRLTLSNPQHEKPIITRPAV